MGQIPDFGSIWLAGIIGSWLGILLWKWLKMNRKNKGDEINKAGFEE